MAFWVGNGIKAAISAENTNQAFSQVTTLPEMLSARNLRLGQLSTFNFEANTDLSANYTLSIPCITKCTTRMTVEKGKARYAMVSVEPLTDETSFMQITHIGAPGGIVRGTIHFRNKT